MNASRKPGEYFGQAHDFRNGVPRLQLYGELLRGGSVATMFGMQREAESVSACAPKSRGSTGNRTPPIWNASVCGSLKGYIPPQPSLWLMLETTSSGLRISELQVRRPQCWKEKVWTVAASLRQGIYRQ